MSLNNSINLQILVMDGAVFLGIFVVFLLSTFFYLKGGKQNKRAEAIMVRAPLLLVILAILFVLDLWVYHAGTKS